MSARQDLNSCDHIVNVKEWGIPKKDSKENSRTDWVKSHRGKGKEKKKDCKEFTFTSKDSGSKIT